MILYEDTRQKQNKHNNVAKYCKAHGITLVQKCLSVGDYMFPNGDIAVDTKANIAELASDLYKDRKVFDKKYKKGLNAKIRLVVLIEEPIKSLKELAVWKSPHSKITGRFLIDLMDGLKMAYGVRFCFCDKKQTGEKIIKLLQGEWNG